jgi:hypothetical protein
MLLVQSHLELTPCELKGWGSMTELGLLESLLEPGGNDEHWTCIG